ncbi:MAG: hypothetical protein ACP5D2_00960 [Candidatus Nanoarchaeia archaeon]
MNHQAGFFNRYWASVLLLVVVIIFIIGFVLVAYYYAFQSGREGLKEQDIGDRLTENQQRCLELGCQEGDKYVGSKNSDKFYFCQCYYADRILQENIICFSSKEEAVSQGYEWVDC